NGQPSPLRLEHDAQRKIVIDAKHGIKVRRLFDQLAKELRTQADGRGLGGGHDPLFRKEAGLGRCLPEALEAALRARVHSGAHEGKLAVACFYRMDRGGARGLVMQKADHHVDGILALFHDLHHRTGRRFKRAAPLSDWSIPETMSPAGFWPRKTLSSFSS